MTDFERLVDEVNTYTKKFRGINLEPFELGPLYDLFPCKDTNNLNAKLGWNQTWPSNGKPGIYVFLSENGEVLYVGKSSSNSTVSARLSAYCAYGEDKKCKLKHDSWKVEPRYVWIVGVPNITWFEAAALEEYLIRNLSPSENKIGIEKSR